LNAIPENVEMETLVGQRFDVGYIIMRKLVVACNENAKVSSDYGLYIISPRLQIIDLFDIKFSRTALKIEGTRIA